MDVVTGAYLWHPELAKELPRDSYHWFVQDIEQYCWTVKEEPVTLFEKIKNIVKLY